MTTLTLVAPVRTCPAWCADHDDEADVCSTGVVRLDFTGAPAILGIVNGASVSLASSSDGTSIHVGMGVTGYGLTVNGARDLAFAILAKVNAAQVGGER